MDLIPEPLTGHFMLAVLPHSAVSLLLRLSARMARRSTLRVLDCGNCFNAYKVAVELRRTGPPPVEPLLERIRVARAFTCYQVLTLLENVPALPTPTLVLDLLGTFRDESVPLHERRRLLQNALGRILSLAENAPLLVSATPLGSMHGEDAAALASATLLPDELLAALEAAAGQVWRFGPPPPALPMRLF